MMGDNFMTRNFIIFTSQKIFKWWYHRKWGASGMWYWCQTRGI